MALAIAAVEALSAAAITGVSLGARVTQVPKGPGASEMKDIANGYNDTYAAYYLSASDNQVTFTFAPADGQPVAKPILVIQNYTAGELPQIWIDNGSIEVNNGTAGSGAFASINIDTNELWVTLNQTFSAATQVEIVPDHAFDCDPRSYRAWYRDADGDGYGDGPGELRCCHRAQRSAQQQQQMHRRLHSLPH